MKKRWLKKAACLGVLLAAAMGLAGCGKDKNVNGQLAKEGVYKFEKIDLPEFEADYCNVLGSVRRDGRVYIMMRIENWSSEDGREYDIRVLSMKDDGTDMNVVRLEIPETNSGGGSGGAVPMPMPRAVEPLAAVDSSSPAGDEDAASDSGEDAGDEDAASDSGEDAGTPDEGEMDIEMPVEGMENDYYENSYYNNFTIAGDGTIYGIRQYNYESYGEEYYSVRKYYLNKWDMTGKFLQETELQVSDPAVEDEWIGINSMSVASDGNVYFILSGNEIYTLSVDPQGNASARKQMPEDAAKMFRNMDRAILKEDGTFFCIYYDENDYSKEFMTTYDPVTGAVGEALQLPAFFATRGFNTVMPGMTCDLVMGDSNGVYTYNIGDEGPTLKMSYVNSDLDINYFNGLVELTENSFIGIYNDTYKDDVNVGLFTYVRPEDIPDKSVLVLAANYVPWDMKRRVVEFNRTNQEYRIVLKEYESYNTYEDWNAGITQLNNDITTGNMPDILVGSGLPMENYAAKGLLEDIGKLIEEDEELSKVEFVQNVLDAYSVDGTLYYVIPSFTVQTMIGKTSLVGDRAEWTMEEAQQVLATMPEGTNLFGEMTRDNYFSTAMAYCAGDFVDVTTGKCDFNSDRFIKMMEYAKSLPETLDESTFGDAYWTSYQSQYRENRTLLMQVYISSIRDLNYNINGRFGEDVSYVGFPMEGGQGAIINANEIYGISSRSNYTEGAWEFLRYYLGKEYQSELQWNLSIHKDRFLEMANEATQKPYWIDENGEKHESEETFYLNGESIVLPQMTQAQVDKVVNYIFSLKKSGYNNENVMNIINEEMGGFFSGQKSAKEVAAVIQNRVQLFVDENR